MIPEEEAKKTCYSLIKAYVMTFLSMYLFPYLGYMIKQRRKDGKYHLSLMGSHSFSWRFYYHSKRRKTDTKIQSAGYSKTIKLRVYDFRMHFLLKRLLDQDHQVQAYSCSFFGPFILSAN